MGEEDDDRDDDDKDDDDMDDDDMDDRENRNKVLGGFLLGRWP